MDGNSQSRATRAVVQTLESLRLAGVTHLAKPKLAKPAAAKAQPAANTAAVTLASECAPPITSQEAPPATATVSQRLELVRQKVAVCTRCAELAATRTQTVFGVGNPQARLLFLGEAPGADEDRLGEPFVGRAGQLLTKIIEACKLSRGDVYIANVLKCRPPGNRAPLPDESANCSEYLQEQLRLIRPEFICCLGATAAQALLKTDTSIGRLRGRFFELDGAQVICTYHPSYLLRNPAAKKDVWEDMKMLMRKMGVELN